MLPGHRGLAGFSGEGDPYFPNVILLIHGNDGVVGTSSIVDRAPAPVPLNVVGNPRYDGSRGVFGGSSLYFDGTGDNLNSDDATAWDFGTGDFTIEFAFYNNEPDNNRGIIDMRSGTSGTGPCIDNQTSGSGGLRFRINNNIFYTDTRTWTGSWHWVAMTRTGGQVRCYIDGGLAYTYANSTSLTGNRMTIGSYIDQRGTGNFYHWKGWLNEIRVTRGVARYAGASYALPTAPFPNS